MEGGAGHRGCGAEFGWQLRQSGGGERWSFTTIGQPVGNLHNNDSHFRNTYVHVCLICIFFWYS